MKYAKATVVSPEKTRAEIEATVMRYGADHFAFATGPDRAMIGFRLQKFSVRFSLPFTFVRESDKKLLVLDPRNSTQAQHIRQRWRALLLSIKAKLESVECGIETVEEAFFAETIMPDGKTVREHTMPQVREMIAQDRVGPLMISFESRAPQGAEK